MIAVDTSAFARSLAQLHGDSADLLRQDDGTAWFPPVVVAELFTNPWLSDEAADLIHTIPVLESHDGHWERAGRLRRSLLRLKFKANLADCLIAQSCIDHDIPLITYDRDFRHFERAGLKFA